MIDLEKKMSSKSSKMKNAEDPGSQGLRVGRHNRRPQKNVFRHPDMWRNKRLGTGSRTEPANSICVGLNQRPRQSKPKTANCIGTENTLGTPSNL